jgi:hypothetical protein
MLKPWHSVRANFRKSDSPQATLSQAMIMLSNSSFYCISCAYYRKAVHIIGTDGLYMNDVESQIVFAKRAEETEEETCYIRSGDHDGSI